MLSLKVDEEIEKKFRKTIGEQKGTHRGNLKNAVEEAMMMYVEAYATMIDDVTRWREAHPIKKTKDNNNESKE